MSQADSATDEFDHELALSRLSVDQDALYEVEAAMNRISEGKIRDLRANRKADPRKPPQGASLDSLLHGSGHSPGASWSYRTGPARTAWPCAPRV